MVPPPFPHYFSWKLHSLRVEPSSILAGRKGGGSPFHQKLERLLFFTFLIWWHPTLQIIITGTTKPSLSFAHFFQNIADNHRVKILDGGNLFMSSLNICQEACCMGAGWITPALLSNWSVNILLKDDVTVIFLLSVSFMVTILLGTDRYWFWCGGPNTPILSWLSAHYFPGCWSSCPSERVSARFSPRYAWLGDFDMESLRFFKEQTRSRKSIIQKKTCLQTQREWQKDHAKSNHILVLCILHVQ